MKHDMQTFTLDDVLAAAKEILAKQHIVRTTVDESGDYPSYQYEICEVWSYGPRTIGSADIPAYALLFAGSTMLASEVERLKSEVMAARADAEASKMQSARGEARLADEAGGKGE